MSTRRLVVNIALAETSARWASSTITLIDNSGSTRKAAVINIRSPSDVCYLREQLDKIERGWQDELKRSLK
jgi:hypothetical protein